MFSIHNTRRRCFLTGAPAPFHNDPTSALVPQVYAPGIDLAGFPDSRKAVPALHPTLRHRLFDRSALLRRAHNQHLWRPVMAQAIKARTAAATPDGDAEAPRRGAAQPPLDLSLGHIGTRDSDGSAADLIEDVGPCRLVFSPSTQQVSVLLDESAFTNREERRAAKRELRRRAKRAFRTMGLVSAQRRPS